MYEIKVFGQHFEDVESIGGWQTALTTSNKNFAYRFYTETCNVLGKSNVALYVNGELLKEV